MKPDLAERLSQYVDGELGADQAEVVESELATSPAAREYLEQLRRLRQHFRYEPVGHVPDIAERVMESVEMRSRSRRGVWLAAAAVFVIGLVAGAAFVGFLRTPTSVQAVDVPSRVLDAQRGVTSLVADVTIVEHNWHPEVPLRTFDGTIDYLAPESVWIRISDTTAYPSDAWVPNHVEVLVDGDRSWSRGPAPCPIEALPACTPVSPHTTGLVNREPFPEEAPAPLDLVVPVSSFARAGEPKALGFADIDGHRAVGVEVTAAQLEPMLSGLRSAGNWRLLHATDRAQLWLETDTLVPLSLTVIASDDPQRALWAARRGYRDMAGLAVFEVRWSGVVVNGRTADFAAAGQALGRDNGFTDLPTSEVGGPRPADLPAGMTLHRSGVIDTPKGPRVWVRAFTDGRAWIKVSATEEWTGERLFGHVGDPVLPIATEAGVVYRSGDGTRVGIHGPELDVVVTGSVPVDELLDVAVSLGIRGSEVPAHWVEAASASIDDAAAALPGLLVPPLADYVAVRVTGDTVVLSHAGPGSRAYVLVQRPGSDLPPPLEGDVVGVEVRRVSGRFSPVRGILEWAGDGVVYELTSTTMSMAELLEVAESLVAAP